MAISGLNRLVIADESGALTGRPLASARAAAEQVATEKVVEAKSEIRSVAVQAAEQAATEKVAVVKSEAVQAAKDSVQSAVADAIAPVVSTTIPAAVESGVRQHAGTVADERIQATVPGMIQSQAATVVESQLSEKLPTAVQAAAGSEITRQIDERVTPTIEAKVSSVITKKSASIKDEVVQSVGATVDGKIGTKIESAKPAIVQAATESIAGTVDSKIEAAKPSIIQAVSDSVSSTIDTKISEGIEQARTNIVSETLDSVDHTIDGKIDAAKTDIARDYNSKIPNIVANTVRELGVGDKNYGFADRNISATSYWWPDFWNEGTQKGSEWRKLLNTGSSLGVVVLDKASGEWGDAVDDNFLKQGMLAEAAGAKWCAFYLSSRFGAMAEEADAAYREEVRKNLNVTMDKVERATFDRIVQQAKNIVAWYKGEDKIKKVAIFIDEAPNGWSDSQKKVVPWYKRLYLRLKQELGQDVLIVINPGSNTVPEMMDACDVAITYESSASKYIDPETKFIHPDHYKTMPAWRFWHVIHGVTKDNIGAVFAAAEKFNIGHLYATDQKFAVGSGSEDEPEENPYDHAPSDWVVQDTKSWVKGVLPFEQRVSQLETIQVVNNRAYSLPEGTDIAGFFLQGGAIHPAGVLWQTQGNAVPSTGLVILVRAGEQVYGYVPGVAAGVAPAPNPGNATPAQPAPVVPAPATPAGAPDAPTNLRVTVNGANLTVTWDTVAGATGYQIAIDGSSPTVAQPGHVFTAQSGQSGIIQVRAVNGDQHSAWTQLGYQVANIQSAEKPIQWVFTYAHGGWKDKDSSSGVLREYFYAPGLKTPDGKAKSFEYPVSHKTGEPLGPPNNIKILGQYLASPGNIFKKDGAYTLVSWTGEGPKAENSDREDTVWERSALTIAKHGVSTAAKSDGSGREYVLALGFTYDPHWINNPNQGVEKRDVKPGDKGLEVKREGDLITMSVVRADGSRERIHWFTYNSIKADAGVELYGGTWGEITGTYFEGA
nr:MAG TPA: Spherulation-specific family 4 [Caudoviricetes sp.]